jgi:putative ABC transport system substrate-binding protein
MKFLLCFILLILTYGCTQQNQQRIAILTPIHHPSLEQAEKGFIETLERQSPGQYRCTTYNAQGSKHLMRAEIEAILQQDYQLVFTIGATASQMTAEVFDKKDIKIPIVFTCVHHPSELHLIKNTITGVQEILHLDQEVDYLLQFKSNIKKILLAYNPTEIGLEKDRYALEHILQEKQIQLVPVEVFQTNEILAKLSPFMEQVDAVIVLKDNTVITGLDALVKLCNQYQIPLMTSDLDSPDRGAALGYGVHEIDFGIEGAKKALAILQEGWMPPITPLSHFSLKVNPKAAEKQGLTP